MGGSAPGFAVRNSPIIWSSWPRSIRLLRRRSQTNHSQAPRSVVNMTLASFDFREDRHESRSSYRKSFDSHLAAPHLPWVPRRDGITTTRERYFNSKDGI